jgi:hypothetical protein
MRMLQFMPAAFGFGPIGMNEKMKTKTRKTIDAMLMGRPALPKSNLDGRSGSPRIRFSVMHEMETIYEAKMAAVESEAIFCLRQ